MICRVNHSDKNSYLNCVLLRIDTIESTLVESRFSCLNHIFPTTLDVERCPDRERPNNF